MQYVQSLPIFSVGALVAFFVYLVIKKSPIKGGAWMFPAALALAFTLFSLYLVLAEGPLGFWPKHSQSFWGVQVWMDLLLALGVSCYFIVPKAKSVGVSVVPGLLLVLCTGSIGMLAFLSRVLYIEERTAV